MMDLSRRQFLIANGAALALPTLPSLAAGKKSGVEKPSKKLVITYIPNGIVRRGFFPGEDKLDAPNVIGGFDADKTKDARRIKNKPGVYPLEWTSTMETGCTPVRCAVGKSRKDAAVPMSTRAGRR